MWRFTYVITRALENGYSWKASVGVLQKQNVVQRKKETISSVVLFASKNSFSSIPRPKSTSFAVKKKLGPYAWFLLLVPISTFALGTWQVRRRKWKQNLIAELDKRTKQPPNELPEDLSELEKMEYYPIKVRGRFDHSKELYLGPRSLIVEGDAANQGGLMSQASKGQSGGYCVITPFKLEDRDLTILVNRGWVPSNLKKPSSRPQGQVEGLVELTGLVRLKETRAPFMPANKPSTWFYRDVEGMAEVLNTAPVFLEASVESTIPGGPIGGQTRVTLRNEHLSYIFTWYSLSAATAFMWYKQFIYKMPAF